MAESGDGVGAGADVCFKCRWGVRGDAVGVKVRAPEDGGRGEGA